MRKALPFLLPFIGLAAFAQTHFSDDVKRFISVDAPTVAIEHVRVVDGTGAAAANDQTIVITNGKIPADWSRRDSLSTRSRSPLHVCT
jgi:hypothetical protein